MFGTDTSMTDPRAAALNRRERAVILLALIGVTAIAWLYLLAMSREMDRHGDMSDVVHAHGRRSPSR